MVLSVAKISLSKVSILQPNHDFDVLVTEYFFHGEHWTLFMELYIFLGSLPDPDDGNEFLK